MRIPKANMFPGVDRFNDCEQAFPLAHGPSIRAVPPGAHPRIGSAGSDSVCSHEDLEIYRGDVRKRARADILGVLPEETHLDQSKQYANPLAPKMAAPVHEAKGVSFKNVPSNPLSRAFGNISKWPRGSFEDSGSGHASQNGQTEDMGATNTNTHGSHLLARSKDYAAYKPSAPSKLRSDSTEFPTRCTDKGSKSENREVVGGSSLDSPTIDTVGGDFASQLERMPLLDDEAPIPKLVDAPWPLPKSKRGSVRQMAAKFEDAGRDSCAPAGNWCSFSEDQAKLSTAGPRNSVSCPVRDNRGPGQAWPYDSLEETDDSFVSNNGHTPTTAKAVDSKGKEQTDERAWERLTAALGHMPPGDLALLQEFLVGQSQAEASTGTVGRRSTETDGRLSGAPGEK